MADDSKNYIGRGSCGCLIAAMVAGVDTEAREKRELRKWIKRGLSIEIVTSADVRADPTFLNCNHTARYDDPDAAVDALVGEARA